ncbi:MAG: protein BatD [Sphingobacteriales bacterium]|nr:protein BatD [Sphingobacteriales bacterium]
MKKTTAIFFLLLFAAITCAQTTFRTLVPAKPVPAGESFRVQYVLQGGAAKDFTPPDFYPFRLVEGPAIYPSKGNVPGSPSRNYIFTLVAPQPGHYIIPGASVSVNGSVLRSAAAAILVISSDREAAPVNPEFVQSSEYYLRPGENVQEKIRQNLYLKLSVDKQTCYVGEPVLATYKLYSRLESRSDIIKNPGFYGFTVFDIIGLADNQLGTEKVNGKDFDVHTIRKVQLYPLQPGRFTIDPIEIRNKVEFSRTVMNRKTGQKIAEGLFHKTEDDTPASGTQTVETDMRTEPLTIDVRALPEKNKPADFNGAVGTFLLSTRLEKNRLAKNEEGFLLITISGKGNFIQLGAPQVEWPPGMEGFAAVLKDSLDKLKMPLQGERQFRYGFVCTAPGTYQLPAIRFSFFDTDSNRYRSATAASLTVTVGAEEKKERPAEEQQLSITALGEKKSRIAIGVVFLLVLLILAYWILKKKPAAPVPEIPAPERPSVGELFRGAGILLPGEDTAFYQELHRAAWSYFESAFALSGSAKNKDHLFTLLRGKGVEEPSITGLADLFSTCEAGMYTRASLPAGKEQLLEQAKTLLEKMNESLF